ncbi:MAG: phenylalanine--tRNA ligase subunit beta [Acidimicrobiia bacterium]|nr:phenylalanine--tRNA ligase subunit beta [Acidimicrobiia bacterium]
MKVSLRWLEEYVDIPIDDPLEIESVFASLGHEVEGYEVLQAPFTKVIVGKVLEIDKHPNADRLRFCRVDLGRGDPQDIVCGAWNFEVGDVVPVSVPGAVLAGGLEVGVRTIRGVTSHGMICSAAELGLGDDHDGIMVLDPTVPIGADFIDLVPLPDVVFDVSITPNRPDAMSVIGLAREFAAYYGTEVRMPDAVPATVDRPSAVQVMIEDTKGCPRYVGREVDNVKIGPSPLWMQLRLRASDVRPINNVVDITNYVLLELGQPLHAFDLDEVADEKIVVRRAHSGETIRTLDGVERDLDVLDLMICDGRGILAFAGIMGGEDSEVTDSTTRVLIEAAHFHAPSVMFSSKRHSLRTEASARFERGVDPNLPGLAAARAARLMVDLAGGEALADVKDNYPSVITPWQIDLEPGEVERILGIPFSPALIAELLTRLHMEVEGESPITVTVPTNRPDLTRPIDLIEEIARLYGYDRFPETLPSGPAGGLSADQQRDRRLRDIMVGLGVHEAQTMSFLGQTELDGLNLPIDDPRRAAIRVRNPLREEEAYLRTTLLPNLLKAVQYNVSHGLPDVALFEVGRVFLAEPDPDDARIPHQPVRLGFVAVGRTGPFGLHSSPRRTDVYTATGLARALLTGLGIPCDLRQSTPAGFHPGRAAEVLVGGERVGVVGELHPAVGRAFGLEGRVAAGELDLAQLSAGRWQLDAPSTYPRVEFDLAFVVDESTAASALVQAATDAAGDWLEEVAVFDEFRGPSLGDGKKSIAIRLVFRAPDHTLTNEELAPHREQIIAAVIDATGGRLRGA